MQEMTGSKLFAEMLQGYGVSHVFYLPAIMLGGLAEMEHMNIRRIMTHGEKSAAYMADGYARASGKPGICMSQQIGASNLAAGLRDAYMANIPLIAITGGPPVHAHYRNGYQEVEDMSQFDAVTKFNAQVDDVSRLPDLLRQAFRAATSGAPGPVHLQIRGPHGQAANASTTLAPLAEKQFSQIPPFRPRAETGCIEAALMLLGQAERPIIIAGGGVTSSAAQAELLQFAEKMQIPVATSLNAKGAISDHHPLAVGVTGLYSRSCANKAVAEADVVFFIGSHTGGQVTIDWSVPKQGTTVIQLDIDPLELGRNYPNAVSLAGDAKAVLQQLIDAAGAGRHRSGAAWTGRVAKLVQEWRDAFAALLNSDAMPIRPERICKEISEVLPSDGVVVADTGHSGMWTSAMIEMRHPQQRFVRCAGSMGWGFPGAMGVKCALPNRTVICFTGDGAFYYHIGELETAARFNINLIVVVNNNTALNQEIPLWDNVYPDRNSSKARTEDLWSFNNTDFAKVAESFGCVGIRVEDPKDLNAALKRAIALNRPVVIDVISDINAYAPKGWTPKGDKDAY
jgi:acetolactate synthase-1/2/3 large subunit